jgi:hypothetical protein
LRGEVAGEKACEGVFGEEVILEEEAWRDSFRASIERPREC